MDAAKSPNRVLDLEELSTEPFHDVLDRFDWLLEKQKGAYLHPSKRWEYPWALQRAALASRSRVLDAGCGGSIFPIYLAAEGHLVHAVDRQIPAGLANAYGVTVDYAGSDISRMPFPDNTFDAVFCISVIEHLGHGGATATMAELHRVLRLGGRLLLTTDYYKDAKAKLFYEGQGESFPVDWGFFDESSLTQLILQADGFFVDGEVDLTVDWSKTEERMRRFHGYPYTSVGVALIKG
jgi:2-polyprenyl-3-methyl-5-hydroxy-6-metoxy-1,4-benzoquinol methylase